MKNPLELNEDRIAEPGSQRLDRVVYHPPFPADSETMKAIRAVISSHPPIRFDPATRPVFDAIIGQTPAHADVSYERGVFNGVRGFWCRPKDALSGAALLYLHGGAYIMGSAGAFRHFVGHIAARARASAFIPEYRLSPEHPSPAAFTDALAVYEGLTDAGFVNIALVGDSAGGGLALAVLATTTQARVGSLRAAFPARAAVVFSPWTDLSLTGRSLETRAAHDPLLTRGALEAAAQVYVDDRDRRDPSVSPLFGSLKDLPPTLIHVGEDEILLDDSLRYAQGSISATCHVWSAMTHVFPTHVGVLAASEAALEHAGAYLRSHLSNAPHVP